MAISGLFRVRTELVYLLVIPSLAHHPVQTNGESPRHRNLGDLRPRRIVRWKYLLRHSGRLRTVTWGASTNKQRNDRTSLLGDVSQPSPIPAGVFILSDYHEIGEALWSRFSAPKEDQLRFYVALVQTLQSTTAPPALVHELDRVVSELSLECTKPSSMH